ncbi:MAG TPA: alpha-glucan family phosphorylase [Fimbriimonadaceae bacterium]|nr:alpha-glucan family phosphorylase [Fimbriimonadaceae bacterium]
MKHPKYTQSFEVIYDLPESIRALRKLAYNFRWTWHHETRALFRELDRDLWDASDHNPVALMASIPKEVLEKKAKDAGFLSKLKECAADLDAYLTGSNWFDSTYAGERDKHLIAYFCAEFGISEGLPIYSGGLGVLAGDHLKAASDLGLPLVGVGLLYSRGYFKQYLSPDNWQQEHYPQYDFYQMPLALERGEDGHPLRISVEFPDRTVTCQIWRAEVGRIRLFLLDSNVLENTAVDQGITDTLYGGDEEMRMRQEMILGMGGLRALQALGLKPTACHMNEGHAAFLSLERIREFMQRHGTDFRTARQAVVSGNVFTTHTPVPAGFDVFHPDLLERYLSTTAAKIGEPFPGFLRLGRFDPDNQGEAFNMAVLAMENANYVNGVSKLHAEVSRGLFQARWPDYPESEVPVEAITNGIHTLTWISQRFANLFDEYLGSAWREDTANPDSWKGVYDIPNEQLWAVRQDSRGDLVRFTRRHLAWALRRRGMGAEALREIDSILDPRVLTIGFARRFATYKRATLMLHDRERLKAMLFHPERPIQFVIAGKSHPRDDGGKKLIQDLVNFISAEGGRSRMVFLEDYDMRIARALVQGVDVWLNNPRRPMEASGTSGMKVVPNGGLNCSILDGWWAEGYERGLGWAIGEGMEASDEGYQDWLDSRTLYYTLENEVAPTFYHRTESNLPVAWIEMIKRSIATHAPLFSTSRMVEEYATRFYVPASHGFVAQDVDGLEAAKANLAWRDKIQAAWAKVRVVSAHAPGAPGQNLGVGREIEAEGELDGLSPDEVSVEVVYGRIGANRDLLDTSSVALEHCGGEGSRHRFRGAMPCEGPGHRGFTVRVVPRNGNIAVKHELPLVRWQ